MVISDLNYLENISEQFFGGLTSQKPVTFHKTLNANKSENIDTLLYFDKSKSYVNPKLQVQTLKDINPEVRTVYSDFIEDYPSNGSGVITQLTIPGSAPK